MSACAITLGGSSGSLIINYILGSNANTVTANFGDSVYIDTTATAVTYTTLTGNLTASSGCLTITGITQICYEFDWESTSGIDPLALVFNNVILDTTPVSISSTGYNGNFSITGIITSIKTLADPRIQLMSYKTAASGRGTTNNNLIIKIVGNYIPTLQVNNPGQSHNFYLQSTVASACVPSGYTVIPNC